MRRNRNLRRDRTSQPESDSERDRDPPIKNIASANTNANVLAASIPVKGGLEQQSSYDLSLPKIGWRAALRQFRPNNRLQAHKNDDFSYNWSYPLLPS